MWNPSTPPPSLVPSVLGPQLSNFTTAIVQEAAGYVQQAAINQTAQHAADALPVTCDSTMGLEQKLYTNLQEDFYTKELATKCPTFEDLYEEAKKEATHVNAWGGMRGEYKRADNMVIGRRKSECNEHENRSPAKLWCILYRMFVMRLTEDQLKYLLKESSKVMLRCIGILYVRFTQPPSDMLRWVKGALQDKDTVVQVAPLGLRQGTSTTLAKFTKNVFLEPKYLDTRFPRIPEKWLREISPGIADAMMDEKERERERERKEREERRDKEPGKSEAPKKKRRLGRLDLDDFPKRKDRDVRREREHRLESLKDDKPHRKSPDTRTSRDVTPPEKAQTPMSKTNRVMEKILKLA